MEPEDTSQSFAQPMDLDTDLKTEPDDSKGVPMVADQGGQVRPLAESAPLANKSEAEHASAGEMDNGSEADALECAEEMEEADESMFEADQEGKETIPPIYAPTVEESARPSTSPLPASRASTLSQAKHQAILKIVAGSPLKNVSQPVASDVNPQDERVPKTGKKYQKKKRMIEDPYRDITRALDTSKDKEYATTLLQDKSDLSDYLPLEDCLFLGEHFWIFTVQQLVAALQPETWSTSAQLESGNDNESASIRNQITQKLVQKMKETEEVAKTSSATIASGETELQDVGGQTKIKEGDVEASPLDTCKDAENILELARKKIENWGILVPTENAGKTQEKPVTSRFRLDGAIKYLLSMGTRNFLASIKVETLWRFLSMKRTETGAVCFLLRRWRGQCDLSELPDIALARHLLGVSFRIEQVLSTSAPIPAAERKWMMDPINSFTGAAKTFLIHDCGFHSAVKFLDSSTSKLAKELEKWREEKGFPPLKGSGKVAMISSWKATAREFVMAEACEGKIIDLSSLMNEFLKDKSEDNVSNPAKKQKRSKKSEENSKSAGYAMHSTLFVKDTLGEDVASIFVAAGLATAADFFDSDTSASSSLYRELQTARKVDGIDSFTKLVDDWKQTLRSELDRIGKQTPIALKTPTTRSLSSPDEVPSKSRDKPGRSARHSTSGTKKGKKRSSVAYSKSGRDALEVLSHLTRRFLKSIDVYTAFDFLSSRSTDIAEAFVKFREAEGMPELKGLGAIASVSGWKAMVRKKAKAMGLDDLSEVEPKTKSSFIVKSKRVHQIAQDEFPLHEEKLHYEDSKACLKKDGKILIAVESRDVEGQYVFELSLRKLRAESCADPFLTYKGLGPRSHGDEKAFQVEITARDASRQTSLQWILPDVPVISGGLHGINAAKVDLRTPFSACYSGCGLLDLRPHGLVPHREQDLSLIKHHIQEFVVHGNSALNRPISSSCKGDGFNILVNTTGLDKVKYLVYLARPIEKGQTVALQFPTADYCLQFSNYRDSDYSSRHAIVEALQTLCLEDLKCLLDWLLSFMLPITEFSKSLEEDATSPESFFCACSRRRRLHWVARRVASAIGEDRRTPDTVKKCGDLHFGRNLLLSEEEKERLKLTNFRDILSTSLKGQIKEELLYTLEFDALCGQNKKNRWCSNSSALFASIVDCAADFYPSFQDEDATVSFSNLLTAMLEEKIGALNFDEGRAPTIDSFVFKSDDVSLSAYARAESLGKDSGIVACCEETEVDEGTKLVFRSADDFRSTRGKLAVEYYRKEFWQIVSAVIAAFSSIIDSDQGKLNSNVLQSNLKAIVLGSTVSEEIILLPLGKTFHIPPAKEETYVPESNRFFLAVVWPVLRKYGWHLHASDTPSSVSFNTVPESHKRSGLLKYERDRKRMIAAREVKMIGLGDLPKLSKRLIGAVGGRVEIKSDPEPNCKQVSAAEILDRFRETLEQKFLKEEPESLASARSKIGEILGILEECFETLVPCLATDGQEIHPNPVKEGQRIAKNYTCEHLVQFLLLLPSTLNQAGLSHQEETICVEICKEVLGFIAENHCEFLQKEFHLSPEYYTEQRGNYVMTYLESKLGSLFAQNDKVASPGRSCESDEELKELVLEEDRPGLTDFIITVLEQALPYRATNEDVLRRNRRVQEGFPGIICKHCHGDEGHGGKYFFKSLESLSTCYTVLEAHYLKCAPDDVKKKLQSTRALHVSQRKQLKSGSQQAYFNRLWRRLQTFKISGHEAGVHMMEREAEPDDLEAFEEQMSIENFSDHVKLLDVVRREDARGNRDIQEALDRYYSCLDYGGRVYNTPSMPDNFSSHWLLAKILPKDVHHASPYKAG